MKVARHSIATETERRLAGTTAMGAAPRPDRAVLERSSVALGRLPDPGTGPQCVSQGSSGPPTDLGSPHARRGGPHRTSVGAEAYGNYGNESTMVIQELEERGLHEDVRKRLALWLKYQGTAKLTGRFSDQEGVFFGSGGTEAGESYVQNHGWIMWALAEHYFMTRDKAWLEGVAPQLDPRCGLGDASASAHHGPSSLSRAAGNAVPAGRRPGGCDQLFLLGAKQHLDLARHGSCGCRARGHRPSRAGRLRADADAYRADILRA